MNELVPYEKVEKLSLSVAKSGFYPGVQTPEQALVLMMIAQAENCHPIQAMQRYHIIKGKPSKQAWAMLADFQQSGGKVEWHEHSAQRCKATFSHPTGGTILVDWDMKKAADAKLTGNENWNKYPENMLHARCVSNGVRFVYPAAANGLYTPEEVQDFDENKFASITPEKPKAVVIVENVLNGKTVQQPEKWTPAEPIPQAILRAVPGMSLLPRVPLNMMEGDELLLVAEQGKRAFTEWSSMPGASQKALGLINEIATSAESLHREKSEGL